MLLKILFSTGIALILSLLLGGILCCFYLMKYYRYWEKRGVTVEENFFLVKNIYKVFSGKVHFGKFLAMLYEQHDEPYFGFYILGQPYLFIRNPQIIKHITIRDFNYFPDRSFACDEEVDAVVAKSVFLSKNTQWKNTRTKLNVLFSPAKIKTMIPTIIDVSKRMQAYLETHDNEILDFKEVAENLITNLGPLIFLGIDSHCSFSKTDNTIKNSIKNIFGGGVHQAFAFFCYIFMPKLVSLFKVRLGNYDFLKSAVQDIITYKENSSNKGKQISDLLVNNKDQSSDSNGKYFDENWLVSQALTFIIAGFIPPASLFSFTLYELSMNPHCQDKLRKEILENFPGDEEPTYEKVLRMKYLNMIISETLRRNPLGGFVNRMCTKDYVIEETGLKISKGIPLLISVDALHADPKNFPNPTKFDPERFVDGTKDFENAGIFIPFGIGQKRCIGEKFTQAAIKIAIVYVVRKFRFEPCHLTEETVVLDPKSISTSPLNGIKLRIHKL